MGGEPGVERGLAHLLYNAGKRSVALNLAHSAAPSILDQLAAIKKMGPLQNLVGMMPGMPKEIRDVELEDSHLARVEAIIHSMPR